MDRLQIECLTKRLKEFLSLQIPKSLLACRHNYLIIKIIKPNEITYLTDQLFEGSKLLDIIIINIIRFLTGVIQQSIE